MHVGIRSIEQSEINHGRIHGLFYMSEVATQTYSRFTSCKVNIVITKLTTSGCLRWQAGGGGASVACMVPSFFMLIVAYDRMHIDNSGIDAHIYHPCQIFKRMPLRVV
jgi:hypothetical protein